MTLDTSPRVTQLLLLVREWQEARKPPTFDAPGVDVAGTYLRAVARMAAADEALAAFDLKGPAGGASDGLTEPPQSTGTSHDEARLLSEALDACLDDYNRMKHTVDLQREQFARETLARSAADARATAAETALADAQTRADRWESAFADPLLIWATRQFTTPTRTAPRWGTTDMSDHDTADRALEAALRGWHNQDHEGRVMCLVEDGSMAEYLLHAADALARRIAEGARLRKVVKALADRACDCAPFGRHECLVCQARTALVAEEPPR